MTQICYGVAMSLDGYIAGPNGEADWIEPDPDFDFAELWARFDMLLMGRRTYEAARKRFEHLGTRGKAIIVISSTLKPADHPLARMYAELDAALLAELRAEASQDIWLMGGGVLFRSMLDLRAIDRVEVSVLPILLGRGVPMLPEIATRTRLKLREARTYPSGMIAVKYDVEY